MDYLHIFHLKWLLKVINESRHDNYTESVMMYHPKPGHHGHSLSCTATNEHILANNALVDNTKLEIFCEFTLVILV